MLDKLISKVYNQKIKIAFPESDDIRVLKAAEKGFHAKTFVPILLGDSKIINELARENNLDINGIEIVDPLNNQYYERALLSMVEVRKGKQTEEECKQLLKGRNYLATMLVYLKIADAALGGATYSTADTIRPALQIIKTIPGLKTVSSAMIMLPQSKDNPILVMGDCAVIINPNPEELADIAIATANTAKTFEINPIVSLLSFSTKGSAKSPESEKVINAYNILKSKNVDFEFDGELQFDASFVEKVGVKKAPGSKVAGHANTFIFPSLEAGNIGYKIAQYLGKYEALGPILQGLNAPINDLSRGCSTEEVYKMAIITVAQALK